MRLKKNCQEQDLNSKVRSHVFPALQFFVLLFFSMFDFYKSGYRIFDISAFALILLFVLTCIRLKSIRASSLILLLVACVYTIAGLFSSEKNSTPLALFFNCFLFFLLLLKEFKPSQKQIELVLVIHLFFFFFQFSYFYATGNIANYHWFTDIDPRLESTIFRPAGLFYEPAIYCYAMFMLTTMLDSRHSKYGVLEALVMVSMVVSVSLLGFVFAALILIRLVSKNKLIAPILCVLPIIFASGELIKTMSTFVENRLFDLGSDASADGRYGNIQEIFSNENLIYHLFGRGFGASFDQFGSSGASASISAVGILGVALFSGWLLLKSRELMVGILSLVAIMISAPIFTYGIFPYWIANIVSHSSRLSSLGWRKRQSGLRSKSIGT